MRRIIICWPALIISALFIAYSATDIPRFKNALVSPVHAQFGCGMTTHAGFTSCGGGGGFTPANLSNLIAWWKADAGISNPGLSNMTWADQSGNGLTLSIQQGQPTVTSNCQHSLPCVVSSGASNGGYNGMVTAANAMSLGGTALCIYVSASSAGAGPTSGGLSTFVANGDTRPDQTTTSIAFITNNTSVWANQRNFITDGSNSGYAANTWQQIYAGYDGTNANVYVGNVAGTSNGDTNTFGSTGTFGVMGDKNGVLAYEGSVGEVVVQKGCNSTDRSNMQTYFHTRWND